MKAIKITAERQMALTETVEAGLCLAGGMELKGNEEIGRAHV